MSLLDDIASDHLRSGTRCGVRATLDSMTPEDAAELRVAIDNPAYAAAAIHRALKRRGVRLSDQSITRHRAERCLCE